MRLQTGQREERRQPALQSQTRAGLRPPPPPSSGLRGTVSISWKPGRKCWTGGDGRAGAGLLQPHAPGAVLTFSPCQVWAWPPPQLCPHRRCPTGHTLRLSLSPQNETQPPPPTPHSLPRLGSSHARPERSASGPSLSPLALRLWVSAQSVYSIQ